MGNSPIDVRLEQLGDRATIQDLIEAAFGRGGGEADLVDRLRRDGDTAFSLLAHMHEDDGARHAVGYAMLAKMASPERTLTLAPLAVHPDWQGRGVGSELVETALIHAAQDFTAVFVLGAPEYYARFGFSAEAAERFECRFAGPHFMVKALGGAPIDVLDTEIVYPRSFAGV